ncbi:MAG: VOC family protein, partial [Pseudomonadota bacterium]
MKRVFAGIVAAMALSGCVIVTDAERVETSIDRKADAKVEAVDTNPLDLRRTTLVVKDIEKSLALYRDALGMTVEYDQELTSPGLAPRYGADGQNRSRLVLLKANDSYIGMLGLWQFLDQTE